MIKKATPKKLQHLTVRNTKLYNGSYLGLEEVPKPLHTLDDFPSILIGIGLVSLCVAAFNVMTQGISVYSAAGISVPLLLGTSCLYMGIRNAIRNTQRYKRRVKRAS